MQPARDDPEAPRGGSAVPGAPAPSNGASGADRRAASVVFGIPIDVAPAPELLRAIASWTRSGPARRVMYANAHVLNQSMSSPALRAALRRADLVYCDGYGVVLAARALGVRVPHRMTGADWIWSLAALCESSGRSLYLLGAEPGVAGRAATRLARAHPRLRLVGTHHGFVAPGTAENDRLIDDIVAREPDIVLVGMGSPEQELWVDRYAERLGGAVVWTVGGLFDYISGRRPRAPRWLADNGLEWIFRLAVEPRRTWRRYLLGNPLFLARVAVGAVRRGEIRR